MEPTILGLNVFTCSVFATDEQNLQLPVIVQDTP